MDVTQSNLATSRLSVLSNLSAAAKEMENDSLAQKRNPGRALWCVVCFDGNDNKVWRFTSGQGREGRRVDFGRNHDAEERMSMDFDNLIGEYGRPPSSVQIITRATPCHKKCTPLIRGLAARFPTIAMITIVSYEDYTGQTKIQLAETKSLLNGLVTAANNFDVEIRLVIGKEIEIGDLMPNHQGPSAN